MLGGSLLATILGIAAMGITTLSHKSLGSWSFVPLALSLAFRGYAINIELGFSDPTSVAILMDIFSALTMIDWLLLGYALTSSQEESLVPTVPAQVKNGQHTPFVCVLAFLLPNNQSHVQGYADQTC